MPRAAFIEQSEYDVTQKIIESLSNPCNRAVLFCVRDSAKEASQICAELGVSLSAVYKSLAGLDELALLTVGGFVFRDGRKIKKYRSRISRVEIMMDGMEPVLNLYPAGPEKGGGEAGAGGGGAVEDVGSGGGGGEGAGGRPG